ncbi:MAG: hypothetical protein J7604_17540 [Sporocytophaga sp.]|uniref:hypothetical protein n=1 Tax=Sporocytophaga sp. TaxID=2231183 RepID=UPI001B2232AB|nr:hypothetical protein [Sporocytophaga sp.]MBO9702015.1 hypothetical protein [Sporocytophaga sp.]
MKNIGIFFWCILSFLVCCKKADEKLTSDSSVKLSFSRDTIFFDTLFTSVPNITKRLLVYNHNKNAVKVSHISLEGLANSPYSLIINGKKSFSDSDVEIRGKDSIYILISVLLKSTDTANAYVVSDKILFNTNGNVQSVALECFAQNANFFVNARTACDTTWTAGKSFVIYNNVTIPEGCKLTIEKGTKVLFHNDASMKVEGTLIVNGEKGKEVFFGSDKRGKIYEDQPGQWAGIQFASKSSNNRINFSIIENADTGISQEEVKDNDTIPELVFSNSILRNMKNEGLLLGADTYLWNTLAYNILGNGMLSKGGGTVYVRHSTMAGYSFSFFRDYPLLDFSKSIGKTRIENSIIWGDKSYEVAPGGDFIVSNSIVKNFQPVPGNDLILKDPQFKSPFREDFHLDSLSPAIDAGINLGILKDLDTKSRDEKPDFGAYER